MIRPVRLTLCLVAIAFTCGTVVPVVRAQAGNLFDVFLNSNMSKGKAGLYFVDARTGLSTIVTTNGVRHTLLEKSVLFQENGTGVIKVAYPDGRIELHTAMQPTSADATLNWITSADHVRLAWSVSRTVGTSLLSDLYIARSDGGEKTLVLHTSSTRNITTIPLALTNDGTALFYSRQSNAPGTYQLFPVAGDVFRLDVSTGQSTTLSAESPCACAVGISPDGRRLARLQPGGGQNGFDLRLSDLSIKSDLTIKAPPLAHTQAGYLLISHDGSLVIYTSARGVPPAKGVPPERYALVLTDVARQEQRVLLDQLISSLRAIAFEQDNSAVLLVGADKDGTYKVSLKDENLIQVSAYTYLGAISG